MCLKIASQSQNGSTAEPPARDLLFIHVRPGARPDNPGKALIKGNLHYVNHFVVSDVKWHARVNRPSRLLKCLPPISKVI